MSKNIIYKTPDNGSYFFGFHDISPWNKKNDHIILHKLNKETNSLPSMNDKVDLVSINLSNNKIKKIDETKSWNYQQGSRLMWYPYLEDHIIFNYRNEDKSICSKVVNLEGETIKKFDFTINSLHPFEPLGVTSNFERLRIFFPAYGYASHKKISDLIDIKNDGIWLLDFQKNSKKLLISIDEISDFLKIDKQIRNKVFLGHCLFSPLGNKFIFLCRYFNSDNSGMITYMINYELHTKKIQLLASGKISHFDWIDNDDLLVWMRDSNFAKKMLKNDLTKYTFFKKTFDLIRKFKPKIFHKVFKDAFYIISTKNDKKIPFLENLLNTDGHPMTSFDGDWLIVDTYPNKDKKIPLYLVNLKNLKNTKICDLKYETNIENSDLKCDAHPRWSTNDKFIGVDTFENNIRRFQILDISQIKKNLV